MGVGEGMCGAGAAGWVLAALLPPAKSLVRKVRSSLQRGMVGQGGS